MPEGKVLTRVHEVFGVAEKLYGVDLGDVRIRFDLFGSLAGQAGAQRNEAGGKFHSFYVRFNKDMLHREAFDHVHSEAVPHEVAHIVCLKRPELGSGHNRGWADVCKALGGKGSVAHNEAIVYGRGKTYEYLTTQGFVVRVSQQIHNRVQKGYVYAFGAGQGIINETCVFSIVGDRGISHPMKQCEFRF